MNFIDFDTFLEKYYPNYDESTKRNIKSCYDTFVNNIFNNYTPEQLTMDNAIDEMFCSKPKEKTSKSKFYYTKTALINLLKEFDETYQIKSGNPERISNNLHLTNIQERMVPRFLYKSLEELLRFIDIVYNGRSTDIENDCLVIKDIVILLWYGYSVQEICDFSVNDIYTSIIPQEYRRYLIDFSNAHFFISPKTSKILNKEANTGKLFDNMTANKMTIYLEWFNEKAWKYSHFILASEITKNGILDDIRRNVTSTDKKVVMDFIQHHLKLNTDNKRKSALADEYLIWLNNVYNKPSHL